MLLDTTALLSLQRTAMAWKLFGRATTPAQLPAELRSILAQMQRERVAFEALSTGARDATQHLTQLTQPIAEAQKVVAELQGRGHAPVPPRPRPAPPRGRDQQGLRAP